MHVTSHKLVADPGDKVGPFLPATVAGGNIKPELIVCHDTAGRLTKGSSVDWFTDPTCNVSAHVVVERDGTITQLVAFNRAAWHAGKSEWQGRQNCNGFSIGIEIVNPGACDKDGRAWFHKKTEKGFDGLQHVKTREHGDAYWMDYTPEQTKAVTNLCRALVKGYPEIKDITGHYVISPGRKVDPNPLFSLEALRQAAFGLATAATLEPVAPQPVVTPAALVTAYQSNSVWSLINAKLVVAVGGFLGMLKTAWDWLSGLFDLLPAIVTDVGGQISDAEKIAKWFQLTPMQWAEISAAIAVPLIILALVRHTQTKQKVSTP